MMKSKFQISVLIIGILVAIFCVLTANSKKVYSNQKEYLSHNSKPEDANIFKTLPHQYFKK